MTNRDMKKIKTKCACLSCGVIYYRDLEQCYVSSPFIVKTYNGTIAGLCNSCTKERRDAEVEDIIKREGAI